MADIYFDNMTHWMPCKNVQKVHFYFFDLFSVFFFLLFSCFQFIIFCVIISISIVWATHSLHLCVRRLNGETEIYQRKRSNKITIVYLRSLFLLCVGYQCCLLSLLCSIASVKLNWKGPSESPKAAKIVCASENVVNALFYEWSSEKKKRKNCEENEKNKNKTQMCCCVNWLGVHHLLPCVSDGVSATMAKPYTFRIQCLVRISLVFDC